MALGLSGIVLLLALGMASLFQSKPKHQAKNPLEEKTAQEKADAGNRDLNEKNARLALIGQDSEYNKKNKPLPKQAKVVKGSHPPKPEVKTDSTTHATPRRYTNRTAPATRTTPSPPRPTFSRASKPLASPAPPKSQTTTAELPNVKVVDPLEQWARLASLGSSEQSLPVSASNLGGQGTLVPQSPKTNQSEPISATGSPEANSEPKILTIRIGHPVPSLEESALPKLGLFLPSSVPQSPHKPPRPQESGAFVAPKSLLLVSNKTLAQKTQPTSVISSPSLYFQTPKSEPFLHQVAIGSTVEGVLITPLVWTQGAKNQAVSHQGQFVIELSEPLTATDGSIALPVGTKLIGQASSVAVNGLVQASIISVVYEDSKGQTHQEAISPEQLLVLGRGNEALMAESINDPGGTVAGQDLLLGLLGAGQRGLEIFNRPKQEITETGLGLGGSIDLLRNSQLLLKKRDKE